MKKLYIPFLMIFLVGGVMAQTPDKLSYQAVIRDTGNNPIANQQVGMQISILQGSSSGLLVYTESHLPTTNASGLISIEIGNGTEPAGVFENIDWSNGPYFIKTQTDPKGGSNYTIEGTSQLLSVPYALHAKTAEKVTANAIVRQYTDDLYGGASTLRNEWVGNPADFIVEESGTYLLSFYGDAQNLNMFSTQYTPDYDTHITVRVYNATADHTLIQKIASSMLTSSSHQGYTVRRYLSMQPSAWRQVRLAKGDVLKLQYNQHSTFDTHESEWYYSNSGIYLIKVGD